MFDTVDLISFWTTCQDWGSAALCYNRSLVPEGDMKRDIVGYPSYAVYYTVYNNYVKSQGEVACHVVMLMVSSFISFPSIPVILMGWMIANKLKFRPVELEMLVWMVLLM